MNFISLDSIEVPSKNGVPIRLTPERWWHIIESHSEMGGYFFEVLDTIENPDIIFEGSTGELLAVRELNKGHFLVVVYKELNESDGFAITAFFTKRKIQLEKKRKIWPS